MRPIDHRSALRRIAALGLSPFAMATLAAAADPGLVLGAYAEHQFEDALAALDGRRHPTDWDRGAEYPVTTVVDSTADRRIDLLENDDLVAEGWLTVKGLGDRLGSHVFVLRGTHEV